MELDEDISPTSPLNRGIYLLERQVVAASIGSCCGRQAMATGGEDLDGSAMDRELRTLMVTVHQFRGAASSQRRSC